MRIRDITLLGLRAIILPASLLGGALAYSHFSQDHGRRSPKAIWHHDAGQTAQDGGLARVPSLDEAGPDPVAFGPEDELPPPGQERFPSSLEEVVDGSGPASGGEDEQRELRRYTIRIDLSTNTATASYHDMVCDDDGRLVRGEHHGVDEVYRVISGARDSPTNIGQFTSHRLLINPRWNMPESIVNENREYYMTARDEHGDLIYYNDGRFYVEPGPHNPLGRIFVPLRDGQGVHGTNDLHTFSRRDRHASHGCVRYEGIDDIFSDILRHNDYQVFDVWRSWTEPVDHIDPVEVLQSGAYSPRLMVRLDPPVDIIVAHPQ